MQEEIDSIHRNDMWEITKILDENKKNGTKCVYKTKYDSDGSIERHNAWLVSK
jgi:hypothetical protein